MSLFLIKSILSIIFILSGFVAIICMLTLMGKTEKKISADFLRKMHKISGFVFFALLLAISYFCLKYWAMVGDQISTRAVFHGVLAFGLLIIFILKISIVQFYKQFLRFAPVLGITVFCLAFVVFSTSGGYYFLRALYSNPEQAEPSTASQPQIQGSMETGAILFQNKCNSCHFSDKEDSKLGPGLKNLLKKETLPHSGRPATIDNVRQQLIRPILTMPSFANLSEQEMADLFSYLETL